MAWVTPTIMAVGTAASIAANAMKGNGRQTQDQSINLRALQDAENNQRNQALVQALINQRSIAGQSDSFGTNLKYDPGSNTWVSTLGDLPKAAQTAAMQAGISRNTTDLNRAQFANEAAMRRAAQAAPAADTAIRNLQTFQPMSQSELTGLLDQQATLAQQNTFRPLVADTLRSFARTGTSAGPVLGQIGRDAATNQRQALIDAQIKSMGSTDQINQGRRQSLEQSAANTSALANPSFQYSGISPTGIDNTMNQVVSQRAAAAGTAPSTGMYGANQATAGVVGAAKQAGDNLADPNYGLTTLGNTADRLSGAFGPGGSMKALLDALRNRNSTNEGDFTPDMQPAISGSNTMYTPTTDMTAAPNFNYAGGFGGAGR